MWFLVSAIVFGALFTIVFKVCQSRKIDTNQVIFFNYLTALLFIAIPAAVGLAVGDTAPSDYSLPFSSCILALAEGFLFMFSFVLMDIGVLRAGVALTTVSSKASLILPVILSWIFLSQPAPAWIPVGLVLLALALTVVPAESQKQDHVIPDRTEGQKRRTIFALFAVFLCYGCSDFGLKIVQHSVQVNLDVTARTDTHLDAMTALIFLSASILSLIHCFAKSSFRKHPVKIGSIIGGLSLGIANTLCTASLLRALKVISTDILYPVYNIGVVLIATVAGIIFFRERLKPVQFIGIATAILAIILLRLYIK